MDHEPTSPNGDGTPNFWAKFTQQRDDTAERSRRICNDFYDFCESLSARYDTLHHAYDTLPAAVGFKSAIGEFDDFLQLAANNAKQALPDITGYLALVDASQREGRYIAEAALKSHLSTIPHFLEITATMQKLLSKTVTIAKDRAANGPDSEKEACNQWVTVGEPAAEAILYEITTLQANLDMAANKGPQL